MGDINIMTENEVINKIYGYLKNQNEHIIMENMTNESVSLFGKIYLYYIKREFFKIIKR